MVLGTQAAELTSYVYHLAYHTFMWTLLWKGGGEKLQGAGVAGG